MSDIDRLSRRMSFKLPIVLRYTIGLSCLFGIVHLTFARSFKPLKKHLLAMPFYIMGLCHEELYQLYCIKTGQPVVWRERGKNLYEQQLKEKQRLRELDEKMKLQGRTLNEQLDKPLNAEL